MRQTAAEIDRAILDVAADIFAVHGFQHSSVQQIADAVGYSKPGLLHRFGSKESLHRAVVSEVTATVQEVVAAAFESGNGSDRVSRVLDLITSRALDRPGMIHMMLAAFRPDSDEPALEEIQAAGYRLVDALDQPVGTPEGRLRVVLAINLIVTAAIAQHSRLDADLHVERERLVPMLVGLARHVIDGETSRPVTALAR